MNNKGMVKALVKDLSTILVDLPKASNQRQVWMLNELVATAKWVNNQLKEELEFEHTLEIFNQHGQEADPPFGAILINDRVLLANYTSSLGTEMNGVVVDRSFITREVAGWAEMEVKNNV